MSNSALIDVSTKNRTYRENSILYRMLENVSKGHNIVPRRWRECIMIDIEKDPKKVDATFYDNRFQAFKSFIEDFLWIETEVVGAADRCIRIYLRPVGYSKELENRILNSIDVRMFQIEMNRCEISRTLLYGTTLVVE